MQESQGPQQDRAMVEKPGGSDDIAAARSGQFDPFDVFDPTRTGGEHDHAICKENGLVDVMGHEQDSAAFALPEVEQPRLQRDAVERVERTERFVEQEQWSIGQHGAEERNTLPHPTRQLRRIGILEPGQPELRKTLGSDPASFLVGNAVNVECEGSVFDRGAPRQQQIALPHVGGTAEPGPERGNLSVECDIATGLGKEPGNDVEQSALARTGRSDQRDELAVVDVETDVVQRLQCAPVFVVTGIEVPKTEPNRWHVCIDFDTWRRKNSVHESLPTPA